jgi:acyl-CoA hydrolase
VTAAEFTFVALGETGRPRPVGGLGETADPTLKSDAVL